MTVDEIRTSKLDELTTVHQPIKRHDAADKIAGVARYAADHGLRGMLHARLVRSQVPSARLIRRDATAAKRVPGVVDVLFGEDVPNNDVWVDVPGQNLEVSALKAKSQILAVDRVRYQGEPVALIIAETEDAFAEAEAAMDIEYEDVPGVYDVHAALADGAPQVHDGGNVAAEWRIDTGDLDGALAGGDVVTAEDTYTTQFIDHAYLEPEAGVGWLDDNGVINLRVSTQAIEHFRDVARVLGVPESKVRVICPYVGGGFGGKEDMTVEPYIALAVQRTRRPVRMLWTRQESLVARPKRHRMTMHYRTAATPDGALVGHDIEIIADAGAYALLSGLVLLYASVTAAGPYRVPNLRLRARSVFTNNTPCSAMRGFGAMQVVFAYESQMDKLARALDLDPAELRKRNALSKGDRIPVGQTIATEVLLSDTVDAVVEAAGELPMPSRAGVRTGRGIASNLQPYGRLVWLNDTSSAWVGFELDGSLTIRTGVPDIGGGQGSALTQIAGEVLGVPLERISVHTGDSALTPLAGTTTATRQLYMSGNAVYVAALALRDVIVEAVAADRGTDPSGLTLVAGEVRGSDLRMPIEQALQVCLRAGRPTYAHRTFFGPKGREVGQDLVSDRILPDFTFGTHLVDVEVDLETGAVRLLRYIASHDVGRAINPQSVEGQIAGAVAQGIGSALTEDVVIENGVHMAGGLFQYLMPTAGEVPDVECIVLESGEGLGPFGARGIGEPPIGPCAAAIANAITDAIGARPTVLPILPERVLGALDVARDAEGGADGAPQRNQAPPRPWTPSKET